MENYEQKYKKAISFLKDLRPHMSDYCIEKLEGFFPELKESEDEKIRKFVIYELACLRAGEFVGEETSDRYKELNDAIAWLEKQGESNLIEEIKRRKELLLREKQKAIALEENLSLGGRIAMLEELLAFTENKQGEQKPVENVNGAAYGIDGLWHAITILEETLGKVEGYQSDDGILEHKCAITAVRNLAKKQREQKHVDKVEPKFKVGDWITNGACIIKITSVDDRYYWHDNDCVGGDIESIDKEYHLWTIKDAHVGDVLYYKSPLTGIEFIVMSSGVNGYGAIDSYCRYNSEDGFDISVPSVLSTKLDDITPATKEQRDFLFQKMHEADYEWDAEKKELKKIEHNHIWSEEDEKMKSLIISTLISMGTLNLERYHNMNLDEVKNWLKSLKPRWKPSEEQMEALKYEIESTSENSWQRKECEKLYNDLQKL